MSRIYLDNLAQSHVHSLYVGPRQQLPLSASPGLPQPHPPQGDTLQLPCGHRRRHKRCSRHSKSAAASICPWSRAVEEPSGGMTGSTDSEPPTSSSGAPCYTRPSEMMLTHAHDSRSRQETPHEVANDASCPAATGVPTTVSSVHSMLETLRGMVACLVWVASTHKAPRTTQMPIVRRCTQAIRRHGASRF